MLTVTVHITHSCTYPGSTEGFDIAGGSNAQKRCSVFNTVRTEHSFKETLGIQIQHLVAGRLIA